MYDIFGKFGAIRQIRLGDKQETRGSAFVVYEDIYDAKQALDHLSGFNVLGRYLIVLYYQPNKMAKRMDMEKKKRELEELKAIYRAGKDKEEGGGSGDSSGKTATGKRPVPP
ncbi:unnamed protein product [Phaeothamnion confervicola]